MHKEEKGEIRSGQAVADSLVAGLKGAGVFGQPAAPSVGTDSPYLCGKCGLGFDNLTVFGKHVKRHETSE
jgi:hypothetical protein